MKLPPSKEGGGPLTPAQARLINDNLGLAVAIAADYKNIPGVELADVVSTAKTGLFKAARHFDPARGTPFAVYAAQ